MKRLSALIVVILIVTILLGMNTLGVFHYRDGVLASETRKDSMFNLAIKYDTLLNQARNYLNLYMLTNDDRYRTQFYMLTSDYLKLGNVSLGYHSFTERQVTQQMNAADVQKEFDIAAQIEFLELNSKETEIYQKFLKDYNGLLNTLQGVMENGGQDVFASVEFAEQYADQHDKIVQLVSQYINRTNREEDQMLSGQEVLEFTMMLMTVLLVGMAYICFRQLEHENRANSYFRQLYTTVVENINAGICILDQDGRFEYMNPEYRKIMNVTTDPSGYTPFELLGEAGRAAVNIRPNTTRERESGNLSFTVSGEEKHLRYDHFIIEDENGLSKHLDLVTDTTETQEMQRMMKDQLKEIKYYSGAKDSFIANMSHEIKTPINAILGMSHFLKNTKLTNKQQDLVRKIETSSDLLLSIINDVLDISKLKSQKMVLYPKAFNLMETIHSVHDMFQAQMQEKGLEWRENITVDPDLCIYLDQTRFIQVLVNLIGNACKFTEKGFIGISIHKVSEDEDKVELRFRIEDTGLGIDPRDIGKLFHEFEQLENHLSKQHTGTGLGLAICKHIIHTMGGHIWVKSEKNEGSRFYFTIPAPRAMPEDAVAAVKVPVENIRPDGRGGRVLVVEDTEINAEVAENLLAEVGITCDMAMDGLEAVNICKTHERDYYHLILMDIHMPRMNGYEASTVLKKELGIESPILALTATSLDDKVVEEYEGIIDGFILKPIKAEFFYAALCDYFPVAEPGVDLTQADDDDEDEWEDETQHLTAPDEVNESQGETEEKSGPFAEMREAIHNMGGVEAIYLKHVNKFKTNYADSAEKVEQELNQQDYEEAKRLVHSVKGLAGTLGMPELQLMARDLETRILDQEYDAIPSALESYRKALAEVIATPLPKI